MRSSNAPPSLLQPRSQLEPSHSRHGRRSAPEVLERSLKDVTSILPLREEQLKQAWNQRGASLLQPRGREDGETCPHGRLENNKEWEKNGHLKVTETVCHVLK
ncbi:hypothetical protein D4764_0047330 [Takifugu flavidus]|uniref:Uncharacterized protein n=1 Tax=Takifugu flavidus TaxID=433684 RepID=A0A5C6MFP9_9TELE|nr:hypothetical protein D4764_0047330 [Takifugu flavidus]